MKLLKKTIGFVLLSAFISVNINAAPAPSCSASLDCPGGGTVSCSGTHFCEVLENGVECWDGIAKSVGSCGDSSAS